MLLPCAKRMIRSTRRNFPLFGVVREVRERESYLAQDSPVFTTHLKNCKTSPVYWEGRIEMNKKRQCRLQISSIRKKFKSYQYK